MSKTLMLQWQESTGMTQSYGLVRGIAGSLLKLLVGSFDLVESDRGAEYLMNINHMTTLISHGSTDAQGRLTPCIQGSTKRHRLVAAQYMKNKDTALQT